MLARTRSNGREKSAVFKSVKIGKKANKLLRLMLQSGLCCRAAYVTRNFFKTQNPRLINESSFKSRGAYDGARTVSILITSMKIVEISHQITAA